MTVEQAVHRMTGELADWYQIDAGHLRVGDRADLVVVDPDRLDATSTTTPSSPSSSTAACPGWSTATTTPSTLVLIGGRAVVRNGNRPRSLGDAAHRKLPAGAARRRPDDNDPDGPCQLTPGGTHRGRPAVLRHVEGAVQPRLGDAVKTFLSDDCIYVDMPVGPIAAARGPEDIVKRLKIGLEPLAGYENHDGVLVSNGVDTMYEHSETWTFKTGEQGVLRFVTVHKVRTARSRCGRTTGT